MPNYYELIDDDGKVFCRINKATKRGHYRISPDSSQYKYCERVALVGFSALPQAFYRKQGYGLTGAGPMLLQEFSDRFGKKIALTLLASGKVKTDGRPAKAIVHLPVPDLRSVNAAYRLIKRRRNAESRSLVQGFLAQRFRRQFKDYDAAEEAYVPGSVAQALQPDNVLGRLSKDDQEALEELFPHYLKSIPGTLRAQQRLRIVHETLDASRTVYLEKVVADFRKRLSSPSANEATWQKFLSTHILLLRSSYGEVLEKESVSLGGKFPDFMLIDPYTYLDIYEIKKPTTSLLRFDSSRKNYFWDTELAKALAQVENYLHLVQRHGDTLINDLRKHKQIDVNIVRPRGYIIAGRRTQLDSVKKQDDFRILNDSLKNVDVLLYDDLLQAFETFVNRLAK